MNPTKLENYNVGAHGSLVMKIPLAPMGVLAPVSAHAGPFAQPPIGTSGNLSARVSAELILPNFPISGQNRVNWGCRGVPKMFFSLDSKYFCY